jgi:hypothetical protein
MELGYVLLVYTAPHLAEYRFLLGAARCGVFAV